jgi:hypothetical protein
VGWYAALGQHEQARAVWREALQMYRRHERDYDADRVQQQLDNLDGPTGQQPPAAPMHGTAARSVVACPGGRNHGCARDPDVPKVLSTASSVAYGVRGELRDRSG